MRLRLRRPDFPDPCCNEEGRVKARLCRRHSRRRGMTLAAPFFPKSFAFPGSGEFFADRQKNSLQMEEILL